MSESFEVPTATKPLRDGHELKLLLTDDPEALDTFVTRGLADPGKIFYLVHSMRGTRWISMKPETEKPLGFKCHLCGEGVRHYSGEWQERVLCGLHNATFLAGSG
jgi:hypothetical protein